MLLIVVAEAARTQVKLLFLSVQLSAAVSAIHAGSPGARGTER